jgi:hypothetical protein
MKVREQIQRFFVMVISVALIAGAIGAPVSAQAPPSFSGRDLDNLVARIALYPDPLLAQVLAAATYSDQIPDAAKWADEHHYLTGDALVAAINQDQLPWDVSVQALLPFPSVLEMMAGDMNWTSAVGNAFLAQPNDVEDAVQRERNTARRYGYLQSNAQVVVSGDPYITIMPVDAGFIYVPAYDPLIVYAAPRAGFFVGGAIGWGFGLRIGIGFRPWGWGTSRFVWGSHQVFIAGGVWGRTWVNRGTYVHPYVGVQRFAGPRGVEHHEAITRSPAERNAARRGQPPPKEAHRGRGH